MRTVCIAAVGFCLAATHLAQANVILEDFSGLSISDMYTTSGGHSANLRTSGLMSSYYMTDTSSMTIAGGVLTASFDSGTHDFKLNFGERATSDFGSFSIDYSTWMNANWGNITGIKVNVSSVSGTVYSNGMSITTINQSVYSGESSSNNYTQISGPGSFTLPFYALSAGANKFDVDALTLGFWLPSQGGAASISIDSIELVGTVPVPEPATASVAALGYGALLLRRRHKAKNAN